MITPAPPEKAEDDLPDQRVSSPPAGASLSPGGGPVPSSATSADTVLATAGYDHTIKLWQIHTALCIKTFQHPDSQVNDLQITPDRRLVAAAGFQHIRIYDVQGASQSPTLNFEGLTKNISTIGFNKDAQWMFSGGEDSHARIWDLRTNASHQVFTAEGPPITCAKLHPSQTELIVGDQSGTIHVWDLRDQRNNERLVPDDSTSAAVQDVSIDHLGTQLAVVNNKGDCYIWSLKDGEDHLRLRPFHKLKIHKRYALGCCFSPDSTFLATTSADQSCKIWKVADFSLTMDLHCPGQRWVWSAAFTGDSQYVVTASSDNLARLWSMETGQTKREYNGHQKPLTCIAYRDPSILN